MVLFVAGVSMSLILPFLFVVVKLEEGRSQALGLDLRSVLLANRLEVGERLLRRKHLVTELTLATDQLQHLAIDLLQLLDHHLLQELLTQHPDRDDGARATTTLVGGDLVRSVVALVAHAISIATSRPEASPLGNILRF